MDVDGVLIIEDHRLLAQTLTTALGENGIAAETADLDRLDDAVATVRPGTVVLLDLSLGAGVDGTALIAPLRARGAVVLVLTASSDVLELAAAVEAGASAVLSKQQPFTRVVAAIAAVRAGAPVADHAWRSAVLHAAAEIQVARAEAAKVLGRLSPREAAVLDELCLGSSAEEIAGAAHVSIATVRAQIRAILVKLDARSQLQAVARAHELRARAGVWGPDDGRQWPGARGHGAGPTPA